MRSKHRKGALARGIAKGCVALALLFMASPARAVFATYYVATDGADSNPGTKSRPLATLRKAQELVSPGDTVYVRGGTYRVQQSQLTLRGWIFDCYADFYKSGLPLARINYWAYPGEKPVFDFSAVKPANLRVVGFYVTANWVHFKGLEITGVQVTIRSHTESYCVYSWGNNNIFEGLYLHDNQGTGLRHRGGGNNLFLNCDSCRNWDYTSEKGLGGNTDGFGCHPADGGTGNLFKGCRSWLNSDDGFDVLGAAEPVTFENCWSFYNGYSTDFKSLGDGNGFKAGGYGGRTEDRLPAIIPRHVVRFCLAVGNKASGFYANHHPGGINFINNSAYRNSSNFNMLGRLRDNVTDVPGHGHVIHNNLGYGSRRELMNIDASKCEVSNNSFASSVVVGRNDFVSLDESLLTKPRKPGGGLPDIDFMKLRPGSNLINKGKPMGFPFNGAAPDLGAFESPSPATGKPTGTKSQAPATTATLTAAQAKFLNGATTGARKD
jgi:hypothetical protein